MLSNSDLNSSQTVTEFVPQSPNDLLVVKLVSAYSLKAHNEVLLTISSQRNVDFRSFSDLFSFDSVFVLEHD